MPQRGGKSGAVSIRAACGIRLFPHATSLAVAAGDTLC